MLRETPPLVFAKCHGPAGGSGAWSAAFRGSKSRSSGSTKYLILQGFIRISSFPGTQAWIFSRAARAKTFIFLRFYKGFADLVCSWGVFLGRCAGRNTHFPKVHNGFCDFGRAQRSSDGSRQAGAAPEPGPSRAGGAEWKGGGLPRSGKLSPAGQK